MQFPLILRNVSWLRRALIAAVVLVGAAQASPARADNYKLSIMDYGLRGFGTGALVGAGTGYLLERGDGWGGTETRNLLLATAIGGVGGAGVGLLIGLIDQAAERPGAGAIILENTLAGGTLGGLVGAATGAITWAAGGSAEDILYGSALGGLIGVGAGLIFGIVQAPSAVAKHDSTTRRAEGVSVRFDVGTVVQNEQLIVVPGLQGEFF